MRAQPPRGEGVEVRHTRRCTSPAGAECVCGPSFQAWYYDAHGKRKVHQTFASYEQARAWRLTMIEALYGGLPYATTI